MNIPAKQNCHVVMVSPGTEETTGIPKIRLYAGKDPGGVAKIIYRWRKKNGLLTSSITSGKLPTTVEVSDAFHVGVEDVNKVVR
jgi:hypothetical protein